MEEIDKCAESCGEAPVYSINHSTDDMATIITRVSDLSADPIALECDLEKMTGTLDHYQEQPHLLDPYLEKLVNTCLQIVKDPKTTTAAFHQTFRYLYLICKTRGAKTVIKFFTHEVDDMEPVLQLLTEQSIDDYLTWQTRYILLLWLSIICMIPFDLKKFDGSSKEGDASINDRILKVAKQYVGVPDKSRDAAAYLLAKFISRPDMKKLHLSGFLGWCITILDEADYGQSMKGLNTVYGVLSVLCCLFKHGSREDLLEYAANIHEKIEEKNFVETFDILLKKLNMKVVQRLGLCLLKPRIASWRYQRGSRSLIHNLQNPFTIQNVKQKEDSTVGRNEEEESYEIPETIELIIQQLLLGLKDKDTIVRWSAAKGIGRISNRLPKDLVDEIIAAILDLFNPMDTDTAWHGGCLALAELVRRGLLLPERLPEVTPVIFKALVFDEKRGNYSLGSHVRDAACYACWSFARAYDPTVLTHHVQQIASSLVVVSLFDRENNCRHAASAAFQEHVGRQGTFPHGIDIVTTVDYFAVANITNCFLNLSVYVANFPEYTTAIIDHLVDYKVSHWDSNIRELSSKALANLTNVSPEYMKNSVLPKLVEFTNSNDLNTRHGGILATAEVIAAVCSHFGNSEMIGADLVQNVLNIVRHLKMKNLFNGLEGDFMRIAVCKLIEKFAISSVPVGCDDVIVEWQEIINECLEHTESSIQDIGSEALRELCNYYYKDSNGAAKVAKQDQIIDSYITKLESSIRFERMGYALGLGALPAFFIKGRKENVVNGLLNALVIHSKFAGLYAESRTNAVKALTRICEELGFGKGGESIIELHELLTIVECFILCLEDYSTDSRGDVGAWVREAAMTGLETLCKLLVNEDVALCPANLAERIFCLLVQQSAEKIDRTRAQAGNTLLRMIHMNPPLPNIPHHQELKRILPQSYVGNINWAAPAVSFPKVAELLPLPSYRHSLLLGITVSVGGLTESLVRHSSQSLLQYIGTIKSSTIEMKEFTNEIIKILEKHRKVDRVTVPLFRTLDLLMSNGCFDECSNDEMEDALETLASLLKSEISRCGDAKKITSSVKVFCGLVQFPGEVRRSVMSQLVRFLCHKYPRVRKETAELLYTTLITYEDVCKEENVEEVLSVLSETEWDGRLDYLRERRNELCALLEIPAPKLQKKDKDNESFKPMDELESYQDLVTRHGF